MTGAAASKLSQIAVVRKSIARVLTVLNQTRNHELRRLFRNKKWRPLDIRQKKTRAIRRRLKPSEANAKTPRHLKRAKHFPQRKFAVKVNA